MPSRTGTLTSECHFCEFSTVAVIHCLIAVEIVLRDRTPGAGGKPLRKLIEQSADAWRDSVRHQDARARGALPGWAP